METKTLNFLPEKPLIMALKTKILKEYSKQQEAVFKLNAAQHEFWKQPRLFITVKGFNTIE